MKTILTIIFLLASLVAYAPNKMMPMPEPSAEETRKTDLEGLIRAVVIVESKNDTLAYNPKENAVGAFQIRQCRVDHYNQLKGTHYVLEDFYDYELSKEMFLFFAQRFEDLETIARRWNGSGQQTEVYWNKVKANIEINL